MLIKEADNKLHKAGLMPYVLDSKNEPRFCFMISSDAEYGGADPQISKGHIDGGESIEKAAVREAEEELGLKTSNIVDGTLKKAWTGELGGMKESYTFHLFTCRVDDVNDFKEPHYETEKTVWLTAAQFNSKGRKSQRHLVEEASNFIKKNT